MVKVSQEGRRLRLFSLDEQEDRKMYHRIRGCTTPIGMCEMRVFGIDMKEEERYKVRVSRSPPSGQASRHMAFSSIDGVEPHKRVSFRCTDHTLTFGLNPILEHSDHL